MNKRGAEFVINKLVAIILVLLILAAVLFLIFRINILEWIRNLPGYSYDKEDKEIDFTALEDKFTDYLCYGENGKYIGRRDLRKSFYEEGRKRYYLIIGGENTDLYVDHENTEVKLFGGGWIGSIESKKIKIDLNNPNTIDSLEDYERVGAYSIEDGIKVFLNLLNGAYIDSNNYLCKQVQTTTKHAKLIENMRVYKFSKKDYSKFVKVEINGEGTYYDIWETDATGKRKKWLDLNKVETDLKTLIKNYLENPENKEIGEWVAWRADPGRLYLLTFVKPLKPEKHLCEVDFNGLRVDCWTVEVDGNYYKSISHIISPLFPQASSEFKKTFEQNKPAVGWPIEFDYSYVEYVN